MQLIRIILALFLATFVLASKKTNQQIKDTNDRLNREAKEFFEKEAMEKRNREIKEAFERSNKQALETLIHIGKCLSELGCKEAPGASVTRWLPYIGATAWMFAFSVTSIPIQTSAFVRGDAAGAYSLLNLIYCDAGLACKATPPNMCGPLSSLLATNEQRRNCGVIRL